MSISADDRERHLCRDPRRGGEDVGGDRLRAGRDVVLRRDRNARAAGGHGRACAAVAAGRIHGDAGFHILTLQVVAFVALIAVLCWTPVRSR